jgi:hypothetical protein
LEQIGVDSFRDVSRSMDDRLKLISAEEQELVEGFVMQMNEETAR